VLAGLRICVYEHVTRLSPLASVQQHCHLPSLANLYVPLNIVSSVVRLDSVILSRAMLNLYHCQFSVESAMCCGIRCGIWVQYPCTQCQIHVGQISCCVTFSCVSSTCHHAAYSSVILLFLRARNSKLLEAIVSHPAFPSLLSLSSLPSPP
jgi:hypothetical protein